MVPRDTYAIDPVPASIDAVPFDRWRELGAEGVVIGAVRKTATGVDRPGAAVQRRRPERRVLEGVQRHRGQPARLRPHHRRRDSQAAAQPERRRADQAHLLVRSRRRADEGHDRGPPDQGDLHRRLRRRQPAPDHGEPLAQHHPGVVEPTARPSPTPRTGANNLPDIFVQRIYEGTPPETPAHGTDRIHNFLPAWSPDGTQDRVHDQPRRQPRDLRDGRATAATCAASPGIPASTRRRPGRPAGNQIAFTSDRSGSPQIYIADADGLGQPRRITTDESWADRATWSPAPFNEIAYAARTGPGYDIKIYDVASRQDAAASPTAKGSNESPAYSPTGRHLAFASTAPGQPADLRRRPRRQRAAPGDEGRQQLHTELVALAAPPGLTETPTPMPRHRFTVLFLAIALAAGGAGSACEKKKPPIARPTPPPPGERRDREPAARAARARRRAPPVTVPPEPSVVERRHGPSLDEINKKGILAAGVLRVRQRRDERDGQAVAGQERRDDEAVSRPGWSRSRATATSAAPPSTTWRSASAARSSARSYLVSLGIAADRLRTVSYGKEFPFDPGPQRASWAKNRRAHFVVTAK